MAAFGRADMSQTGVFHLPAPHVLGLEKGLSPSTIELIAGDGLILSPQAPRNLLTSGNAATAPELPRERLVYTIAHEDYGGRFLVVPSRRPSVRLTYFV